MSSVEEIEDAVERLSSEELSKFRAWFSAFDADRFDAAIETDIAAGKLKSLAEEAVSDYRSGGCSQL